jgi:hypothetical protein
VNNSYPNFEEILSMHSELEKMESVYWKSHDLFSFQWWLLLLILIVPWIVWIRYVDRNRIKDILLFGALLIILVGLMDELGVNLSLWSYPYKLTYLITRLTAIDYGIIIVVHMFVYQFFRDWKSFLIVNTIIATIFTFICEPITVWLGIYKLGNWKYIYSLPIYILKASFIKWIVDVLLNKFKS